MSTEAVDEFRSDARFARYGRGPADVAVIRAALAAWPRN